MLEKSHRYDDEILCSALFFCDHADERIRGDGLRSWGLPSPRLLPRATARLSPRATALRAAAALLLYHGQARLPLKQPYQPPFSRYWPCCQLEVIFRRAARFSCASPFCMNFSTQIGVRTVTTAAPAWSAASLLAVAPVTHPPQENPMTIDATAPITIPCRRRVRDSPRRIDGTCMGFVPSTRGAQRTQQRRPVLTV